MNKPKVIKVTKAEKIKRLVESIDEGNGGVTTAKARLNRKERNFLKKHSDWIVEAFRGTKKHVKAKAIVQKMRAYGLNVDDLDDVLKQMGQHPFGMAN